MIQFMCEHPFITFLCVAEICSLIASVFRYITKYKEEK